MDDEWKVDNMKYEGYVGGGPMKEGGQQCREPLQQCPSGMMTKDVGKIFTNAT